MKTLSLCKTVVFFAFALTTMVLFSSCGKDELQKAADNDYYPLAVGYVWDYYEETTTGVIDTLRYEVTAFETVAFGNGVGDKEVYVIDNTFPDTVTTEWRRQYYFDNGVRVDRLQHDIYANAAALKKSRQYVPGFFRFDRSRLAAGDEWTESITRYDTIGTATASEAAEYHFLVSSVTATVTLKDGTVLKDCIEINRTNLSNGETKVYSFAAGIGKVMEITTGGTSNEKTELLMAVPDWVTK